MRIQMKSVLMTCVLMGSSHVGLAASPIVEDWDGLAARASTDGATPVLIDLANVSLVELKFSGEKLTNRVNGYANMLLAELGDGVWPETVNVLRNGQMTAYLTSAGLAKLRSSKIALAFRAGQDWSQQSRLHRRESDLEKINQRIRDSGIAGIQVLMNVEGLAFDM